MAEIYTALGMMDEDKLTKTTGVVDTENDTAEWTEYHTECGELVRRDVHLTLKKGLELFPEQAAIG